MPFFHLELPISVIHRNPDIADIADIDILCPRRFFLAFEDEKVGKKFEIQEKSVFLQLKDALINRFMPEICRFFGIIIAMFGDDHNPPHFHVRYGDYRATITIDKGIVQGQLPRRVLNNVFVWMDEHYDELMANWARLQNGEAPLPIEPLKK